MSQIKERDGQLLQAKELLETKLASKDEELEAAKVRFFFPFGSCLLFLDSSLCDTANLLSLS